MCNQQKDFIAIKKNYFDDHTYKLELAKFNRTET